MLYQALRRILSVLENLQVPYAWIGGLALAFYEVVRATKDLNLLILLRLGKELERRLNFMAGH